MRNLFLLVLALPSAVMAQGINAYAEITAVSGTTLTVGSSYETVTSFAAGKDIVIMQMQDNVIGANTANNASFGNLSAIQQAGLYTVREIASVARTGPTLMSITLTAVPGVSFNTCANCRVQAITFELLGGGGNHTVSSPLAPALAWNGTLGGVLAFQVGGTLTVAANITADAVGFRGGARDRFSYTSPCNTTDYVWSSTAAGTEFFASKGEGIYRNTNTALDDGRGKMINGGGGANQINAGGGGGGNFTAGGSAPLGWSCTGDAGGIGGVALGGHVSAGRVFMGGGGGGGEGNDDVSTNGANGGGIILIDAAQMVTTGTCSVRISADGGTAANSGNDGAGAGGAGGSIVLQVPSYSFSAACPLTIRANGGNGGSVNSSTHGGGGGGGQGAIVFSGPVPTTNVVVQTNNGTGGCDQSGCSSRAGNGSGTNGAGIVPSSSGPLPIELLDFAARPEGEHVHVQWATATERNNDHFTVERSRDLEFWETVVQVPGAINSSAELRYAVLDPAPLPGLSYYRLVQTDTDGSVEVFPAVAVNRNGSDAPFVMYPNPANDRLTVVFAGMDATTALRLVDELGRTVPLPLRMSSGMAEIDLSFLTPGVYTVSLQHGNAQQAQRLVVRH
ncbi:MAG: T9SS type A sorting domain-containing protein [Flavobacteriales bacterium]|nr:MAG: T9SS type A sorting domain-containing protein [Flavobacteriales bacterium]